MKKTESSKRTAQQNKAMHLWFTMVADALNAAGLDMRKTLKPEIEIPWSGENVKDFLWRPVQKTMLGVDSTTDLKSKDDIDKVYDVLNRHLGEKFQIHIPFPDIIMRGLIEDND